MPYLNASGMVLVLTISLKIAANVGNRVLPEYLRCSAVSPISSGDFPLFNDFMVR